MFLCNSCLGNMKQSKKKFLNLLILPSMNITNRRGMVLFLVLIVAAFMFLVVYNVAMLSQGEIGLLVRTETMLNCELATRTLYQELINPLRFRLWENRSFKNEPHTLLDQIVDDMSVNALIENTPGQEFMADVWITASKGKVKRTVFYRVTVSPSVYQKMNAVQNIFYSILDPGTYGSFGDRRTFTKRVDQILQQRFLKQNEEAICHKKIIRKTQLSSIMGELGLPVFAELMDVQPLFCASAKAGYNISPLDSLTGETGDEMFKSGSLSVDDFRTVQDGAAYLNEDLMKKLEEKLGTKKSFLIVSALKDMEVNVTDEDLANFLADSSSNDNNDWLSQLENSFFDPSLINQQPSDGTAANTTEPEESIPTIPGMGDDWLQDALNGGDDSGDQESSISNPTTDPATTTADVNPSGQDVAENPPPAETDSTVVETPADPAEKIYTFDDLISVRDIYDPKFEKRWKDKDGFMSLGLGRSVAAYMNQSTSRKILQLKMKTGTASLSDLETYVRAFNSYSSYTVEKNAKKRAERKRDSLIEDAKEYFRRNGSADSGGVPVDSDGKPQI